MKKTIALFLVCLALIPSSFAAKTLVNYEELTDLIRQTNGSYLETRLTMLAQNPAFGLSAEEIRLRANALTGLSAGTHDTNSDALSFVGHGVQTALTVNRALEPLALQLTLPAQQLYHAHYINQLDWGKAARNLTAAEEDLALQQQKYTRGLISLTALDVSVKAAGNARTQQESAEKKLEENLKKLADYLGIQSEIQLGALPEVDLSDILRRDSTADKAAYLTASSDVRAKETALLSAKENLRTVSTLQNGYLLEAAEMSYISAVEKAESEWTALYNDLLSSYENYVTSTIVSDTETMLRKVQKQVAGGLLPANRLKTAEREVQNALDLVEMQRLQLGIALLQYENKLVDWPTAPTGNALREIAVAQ